MKANEPSGLRTTMWGMVAESISVVTPTPQCSSQCPERDREVDGLNRGFVSSMFQGELSGAPARVPALENVAGWTSSETNRIWKPNDVDSLSTTCSVWYENQSLYRHSWHQLEMLPASCYRRWRSPHYLLGSRASCIHEEHWRHIGPLTGSGRQH